MKFRLTPKSFYFIMIGVNTLVIILLFGIAFYGNNLIKEEADKLKVAKTNNQVINEQQTLLIQAKKDIEKYKDLNEVTKSIVPQDKDQARTVREISKIASETGVAIKDIKFQTSNLGQATPKPVASADGTSTAPATPALIPISQVKAVDGIKGVFALQIDINSQDAQPTNYADFIKFLERLENNRRTAHVDKINIRPLNQGNSLAFSITLIAYVKP